MQIPFQNSSKDISKKKIFFTAFLMVLITTLGAVIGKSFVNWISNRESFEPKEFSSNGLTITLTTAFREENYISQAAAYSSKDVLVLAAKESFSSAEGIDDLTLHEYSELVLEGNNIPLDDLDDYNGIPCFEYDAKEENLNQIVHYKAFMYKTEDAFWMIQFGVLQREQNKYIEKINEWAGSVHFD